ncbi:hypothetical protein PYW07_002973 [Mythimna separata]|uniref:Uncharacterized protein n=1 Tax=Mythimna separata TaxID=271217 RepID=A0AAD7YHD5_MYTSE|nr:hypothetical protein PYW07_002973 [Mythimna separata]
MNELLQKHGCSTVFSVPDGLRELMSDITREVLRWQPAKLLDFIANYLSALLITREHGIMAVKILEDLCDCRPTVSEHLLQIGLERPQAEGLAAIIKEEIEKDQPVEGKEKVKEVDILKKVLHRYPLDEEMSAKVCQVARNAYRDYWYRKNFMQKTVKSVPEEAWEKAAQHTLDMYKKTNPSMSELRRATEKIQAAYRGYHVRRNVLKHLAPTKRKKSNRKVELPGPPLDIATSREIDLGPVIQIKVKEDNVKQMFDDEAGDKLGLKYDPKKTITLQNEGFLKKKIQVHHTKVSVMELVLSKPHLGVDIPLSDHEKVKTPIPGTAERYSQHHRISFAETSPVIIKSPSEDAFEVPEVPGLCTGQEAADTAGALEVPEELPGGKSTGNSSNVTPRSISVATDENVSADEN